MASDQRTDRTEDVSRDAFGGWSLACTRCGVQYAFEAMVEGCPVCRAAGHTGVLECHRGPGVPPPSPAQRIGAGLERYADLLPVAQELNHFATLGAGGTALVRSRAIGPALGLEQLWFKVEGGNPTGSFKDRYVAVSVHLAQRFGYSKVVVSSTGNLGVSTAAYAAALNLECLLIALPETSPNILAQARAHGARVVTVLPDERQNRFEHEALGDDCFPIGLFLPRPIQNPYGVEGYRTIGYEIIETLGTSPQAVLFPCARGNGLYGAWKGFADAALWGWTQSVPAMVACQPVGANSLEVSMQLGVQRAVELPRIESVAFSAAETVADDCAIRAIRESGGVALSADDAAIANAVIDLAREGLYVEPASALPVACLGELVARERIEPSAPLVCVLTGSGARWPPVVTTG